jgi:hypothetical protein
MKCSRCITRGMIWLLALSLVSLTLTACTRSSVPVSSVGTLPVPETEQVTEIPVSTPENDKGGVTYAVVWVAEDATLNVRKPAGISGSVVGQLAHNQRGVQLTGPSSLLGSSRWVEIEMSGGGNGWVNAWNLTEDVSAVEFCADPQVLPLLEAVVSALVSQDGETLASLVNPQRGLILLHDWWNPEVIVSASAVKNIFTDLTEVDWGFLSGTEFPIRGSFRQVIVPQLEDVFTGAPEITCNVLTTGVTSRSMIWPGVYENMNYYAFHRPVREGGNKFDWRTWVMGIEYVGGKPFLSMLVQYRGDI